MRDRVDVFLAERLVVGGDARQRQRLNGELPLRAQAERLAAGHDDPQGRAQLDELTDVGGGLYDVFEVVDDQQQLLIAQRPGQRQQRRLGVVVEQTAGTPDRARDQAGIPERRQVDEAHALRELGLEQARRGQGQARLAHTAGTAERQQTRALLHYQLPDLLHLASPADQWPGRHGQARINGLHALRLFSQLPAEVERIMHDGLVHTLNGVHVRRRTPLLSRCWLGAPCSTVPVGWHARAKSFSTRPQGVG